MRLRTDAEVLESRRRGAAHSGGRKLAIDREMARNIKVVAIDPATEVLRVELNIMGHVFYSADAHGDLPSALRHANQLIQDLFTVHPDVANSYDNAVHLVKVVEGN